MREILRLAIPSIISNITVPLLSLVDIAIVGHMGSAAYLGAISVGAMIFNVLYWVMGFLRMGTSGLTAQAYGRGDQTDIQRKLSSSLSLGFLLGLSFIILFLPIREVAVRVMQVNTESIDLVRTYFNICILGAPASLCIFGLNGWLIGMQNTRTPMFVAIMQNVINIILSLLFVYVFGLKMEGVALGTMLSQWFAFLMLLFSARKHYGIGRISITDGLRSLDRSFFTVNRDIFLRTLCLVAVNLYFTSAGSAQGNVILSVNTLLMTFFTLFSYFLDGFAFAGEALSGRYFGAGDTVRLRLLVRQLMEWGAFFVGVFTAVYAFGGDAFLRLLTDSESVIAASHDYTLYSLLIPVCGVSAFIFDGIFVGLTRTREMLLSCAVSAALFFILCILLFPSLGNAALWIALLSYLVLRGIILASFFYINMKSVLPK